MNIVFYLLYSSYEAKFAFDDGGTAYGNRLMYPMVKLRECLEVKGHKIFTHKTFNVCDADIVVFLDIDENLYNIAKSLPKNVKKILLCAESPIYAPVAHHRTVMYNKLWSKVLTHNRSYSSDNIKHYDIPIAGLTVKEQSIDNTYETKIAKGVAVSSFKKNDRRGIGLRRDALLLRLAYSDHIDLYGQGWKVDLENNVKGVCKNKIYTMEKYRYALLFENVKYSGYVTEKLGDAILAGIPSIYYGDFEYATRRFPGTFIFLEELTFECILAAIEKLEMSYLTLLTNVKRCRENSYTWCDSFIETFIETLEEIG